MEKVKILAIDDNQDNLITLKALISESFPDSEIITALNGATGIKLAEQEDPSVILLDVVMPVMDGFEVCRKLKSNPVTGDIPVVFITAIKGDKEARIRALEVGAEAFLSKPIDEPELVAQIRAMQKIKEGVARQRDEKTRLAKMVFEKTYELEQTNAATLNLMEDLREEIEARKKNEAELKESENRYRNLIMNSPDAIFINHNDEIALVNRACMKLFGATKEEQMVGKSQYEFTHPDYHDMIKERVYQQRVLGKSVPVVEEKIIRLDGSIVDVDVVAAPFEHKGSIDIHVIMRDITARKEAEQQMRLQAVALNAAANAITITDPDGNFVWANPAYEELTGYTLKEIIGKNTRIMNARVQDKTYFQNLWNTIKSGNTWHGELISKRKDGSVYTGEGTISPVVDSNGKISHLIGIVVDITARLQAEQQLFLQAAALNSAANAIVITDKTNRFEWVNPAFTELTGYTLNEIIGKESSILSSGMHDNVFYKQIWDTVLAGEIWRGELINKRKDGSLYTEENSITPLMDSQGNVEHFIGIKVDITERKRIEEQLRLQATTLNTIANGVIIASNSGIVEWVNPAFTKITGYSPDEVMGKNLSMLRSGFHEHQYFIDMWETLNEGDIWSGEIVNRRKDGKIIIQSNTITPIKDSNNSTVRIVNVFEDITERKHAEQQIRLQAAALDSAANAIVIVDRQGLIDWINPAFTRLTGYSREECLGNNLSILRSEVQDVKVIDEMWKTVQAGEYWSGEIINKRKDGTLYYEENAVTPLMDSKGEVTHIIQIKVDITERKNAEAALSKNSKLQEKMAALGRELAATLDLEVIYQQAERYIKEMIDSPIFGIILYDAEQNSLKAAYYASDGVVHDPKNLPTLAYNPQYTSAGRSNAIAVKTPIIVNDLTVKRKGHTGMLVNEERKPLSAIYVPMVVEGKVIGLLDLHSYQKNAYKDEDGAWLSVVANQIGLAIQNVRLFTQTQKRVIELSVLHNIDQTIASNVSSDTTFENILEQIGTQPYVDAVDLYLYNSQNKILNLTAAYGFRYPMMEQPQFHLGEATTGRIAQDRHSIKLTSQSKENPSFTQSSFWKKEEFSVFLGLPLLFHNELKGVLEIYSRSEIPEESAWLHFMDTLAQQVAIAIDNTQLFVGLQNANTELLQAYDATIAGWSQAMDLRDKETEGHTERVMEMTMELAREFGMSEEQLVHIRRGALLHDIGKLGVPDSILHKPGPLTDEEWKIMRKHPIYAHDMIASVDYLRPAISIPYCHHEKWDGSGYPRGLKGEEIPQEARIFSVIDVWDALTSDRPYRKAWSCEDTIKHIQENSGKHFDPDVVDLFIPFITKYQKGLKTRKT